MSVQGQSATSRQALLMSALALSAMRRGRAEIVNLCNRRLAGIRGTLERVGHGVSSGAWPAQITTKSANAQYLANSKDRLRRR